MPVIKITEDKLNSVLNKIDKEQEIIIYGANTYTKYLYSSTSLKEKNIPYIVDVFHDFNFLNIKVKSFDTIKQWEGSYIIVSLLSGQDNAVNYLIKDVGYNGNIVIVDPEYSRYIDYSLKILDYFSNNKFKYTKEELDNLDKEVLDIKPEKLEKAAAIYYCGRSGSVFFQSLLDNHPNILMIPGFYINDFYQFWDFCDANNLNVQKRIQLFVSYYDCIFDANCSRGKSIGLHKMGIDREEYLGIDRIMFVKELNRLFTNKEKVSRKYFFQSIHLAYANALNRRFHNVSGSLYIVIHLHVPSKENTEKLLEDFTDAALIHTFREPIQSFGSFIKSYKNLNRLNINSVLYMLNNLMNTIPISEEYINQTYVIKLEDLHIKSKLVLQGMCEHLNIPWSDSLLESTFDGVLWWNLQGSSEFRGVNNKTITKSYNEFFSDFDRFRLRVLFNSKCKNWGYSYEEFNDYYLTKELLEYPFNFEKYLSINNSDAYENRKKIKEYLLKEHEKNYLYNGKLENRVTLIKPVE